VRSGSAARATLLALLAGPAVLGVLAAGCGSARRVTSTQPIPPQLLREARPIGRGPRFQPGIHGPVLGPCRRAPGARVGVHLELFAANRVVIIPAGIGTLAPRTYSAGRISSARCYGDLVTLDPTGLVLVRPGRRLTVGSLFRSWGQPLSPTRLASFPAPAGTQVAVFVDGRRQEGSPGGVPLARHAEIVLEVGPHVPPHPSYTFPPGT
jgi:hypothetical protein